MWNLSYGEKGYSGVCLGSKPRRAYFVGLLKACAQQKDLCQGTRVHIEIVQRGLLEDDPHVASMLVSMYVKCGAFDKAQEVMDELPKRDIVTWSALIAGYAQQSRAKEAFKCFEKMQYEGLSPNAFTFACMLKACGTLRAADRGKQIHDEIIVQSLLGKDKVLGAALVDMYVKSGALTKAQEVLDALSDKDVVIWSTLIAGYAEYGQGKEALKCFARMQQEGFSPDIVTLISALKACGNTGAIDEAKQLHEHMVSQDMLRKNICLGNALMDVYAKCNELEKAQSVSDELPVHNTTSWNVLISGYAQQVAGKEALTCFEQMLHEGLLPDTVTFACVLKACGSIRAIDKGKQVHNEIAVNRLLEKNIILRNALVDMYVKCGALAEAKNVIDDLSAWDIVSVNTIIAGYTQQQEGKKALNYFEWTQCMHLPPNEVTFICVLKACGIVGAADKGKEVHDEILCKGFLEKNIALGTALIDMYGKCGFFSKAQQVFDELPTRDNVCWNALIAGLVQQDQCAAVLGCFERMQQEGMSPNVATFINVLKVCSSRGAVHLGKQVHN